MSLDLADRSVADVLGYFAKHAIEVGLIVPTPTGMGKSIMDAHVSLRDYLALSGCHDYATQGQGAANKKTMPAFFVATDGLDQTTASLYRPDTKRGDPRLWFYGLTSHAQAGNVLAVLANKEAIYIVNASDSALLETGANPTSSLGRVLAMFAPAVNPVAIELLGMLRDIAQLGMIPTLRNGPRGVGLTLENLLGIRENSSKSPDYKGIEIKSARVKNSGRATTRGSLFSAVPDWQNSACKHPRDVLNLYGYKRNGRTQLYCSLADVPNSFGLCLKVENPTDVLHAVKRQATVDRNVVQWPMPSLRSALEAKHKETFWVTAHTKGTGTSEQFHYVTVQHTAAPLSANLSPLLETGRVEMDFTLSFKDEVAKGVRDHGYLFKLWAKDRHLLFPPATHYDLMAVVAR